MILLIDASLQLNCWLPFFVDFDFETTIESIEFALGRKFLWYAFSSDAFYFIDVFNFDFDFAGHTDFLFEHNLHN